MSFVYKRDGRYLICSETTTHTGTHYSSEWTDDLQKATVFYSLPSYKIRQVEDLRSAERVEVKVTRIVDFVRDREPNQEWKK